MFVYHLRHALRLLVRERGFTAAAVLTLALGVGANAAVFAVVDAVLLRPLPVSGRGRLVTLNHRDQRTGVTKEFIAIGDYVDLRARSSRSSSRSARTAAAGDGLQPGRTVPRVARCWRRAALLDALGVTPSLGRALSRATARPGAAKVAVLGHHAVASSASAPIRAGRRPRHPPRRRRLSDRRRRAAGLPFSARRADRTDRAADDAAAGAGGTQERLDVRRWDGSSRASTLDARAGEPGGAVAPVSSSSSRATTRAPSISRRRCATRWSATASRRWCCCSAAVGVVLLIACANVANLLLARRCRGDARWRCAWRSAPVAVSSPRSC